MLTIEHSQPSAGPTPRMHAVAQELEAAFLSLMLKDTGLGDTQGAFAGGAGEAQFASLLRDEYASAMAQAGGIGLAEHIVRSLSRGAQ